MYVEQPPCNQQAATNRMRTAQDCEYKKNLETTCKEQSQQVVGEESNAF